MLLIGFIILAVALRLGTLAISMRNERSLIAGGGTEYGAATSRALAAAHVAYYLSAIAEGLWRSSPPSAVTLAGVVLFAASMGALFWVIRELGRFWTVKLILARDHQLVTSRIFRAVRHPNYYLNIIPELVGLALALQAPLTLFVGLPLYLVILLRRIRQEERVMHGAFAGY